MQELSSELQEKMQGLVDRLANQLDVDVCSLYLFDEKRQELILAASRGLNVSSIGYRMSIQTGLTGMVARTRVPLPIINPSQHPEFHFVPGSGEEKYKTYLGMPILKGGELKAVMVVQTIRSKVFLSSEIEAIQPTGQEAVTPLLSREKKDS